MDADSADFAVDFGPNSFTIQGEVINARLRGVRAKSFTYDVVDGELLAEDISTTVLPASLPSSLLRAALHRHLACAEPRGEGGRRAGHG